MVAGDIAAHYDFPAERIHHIPNGVDLDRFDPGARALYHPALRARLGVPDDRQVALFVGSGFARKGLLYAMRALARLGGETELWVVGKDSRTRSFQATAERLGLGRRVRFVGPQDDVLPWYGAADIAVLPSIYEPFGTVALEAMACGLPIVVGEGCGSRELVRRFDPSLIREVADETDLAAGLDRALALARQPETAAAARAAAAHYGFDKQVDRMLELYEQVLRG
jgi:UDP-glucose:(heptosyl)LPS alpha-1,3-glucosyltransferase